MNKTRWQAEARLVLEGDDPEKSKPSSLEEAVRRFAASDWEVQSTAALLLDQEISISGQQPTSALYGDEIDALVQLLLPLG